MKGLFIPEITAEMFRNACLESIEELMAEGEIYDIEYSDWIHVSERLPEYGTEVLTCSSGGFIEIQSLEDGYGGYWENRNGDWSDFDEVAAWMPLPKRYESQESEGKE